MQGWQATRARRGVAALARSETSIGVILMRPSCPRTGALRPGKGGPSLAAAAVGIVPIAVLGLGKGVRQKRGVSAEGERPPLDSPLKTGPAGFFWKFLLPACPKAGSGHGTYEYAAGKCRATPPKTEAFKRKRNYNGSYFSRLLWKQNLH